MSDFREKTSTQKGALGERIGRRYLERVGFHVYSPDDLNNPHPIDNFAIHRNKPKACVFDCKAKPRRLNFPDTGIDMRHFLEYWCIEKIHGLKALLIFVDEVQGKVYGNLLERLWEERRIRTEKGDRFYPCVEHWKPGDFIVYFPIVGMLKFDDLTSDEQAELAALSTRARQYDRGYQNMAAQGNLL